jgi:hypothetical protein
MTMTPPPETGGGFAVGGAMSTGGSITPTAGTMAVAGGAPPQWVDEAACGVPVGQPQAISAPITNYMLWWSRLSKLIWADQAHAAPADLPSSISYQQAGQIADEVIDQAIMETKGIPGITPFVRRWLQLDELSAPLVADWNRTLSKGPAITGLLTLHFDTTRVGAFTEPAFLTRQPAISWRGAAMVQALFDQQVPPEPPGITPFMPPAGVTRREGLSQAVASPACAACHSLFDPVGFSLENYDRYGMYGTVDAGQAVDASGSCRLPVSGIEIQFKDIADLGQQLLDTCDANFGLADQFLVFALEQSRIANPSLDDNQLDRASMRQAFMRNGRTYRSLIRAFAQSQAMTGN